MFPINGYGYMPPNMPMQPQPPNQAWASFSPFGKGPGPNMPGVPNMPMMPNMPQMGMAKMPFSNMAPMPMPMPNMNWQPMTWQPTKPMPMPQYDVKNMGYGGFNQPNMQPPMGPNDPTTLGQFLGAGGGNVNEPGTEHPQGPDLSGSGIIRGSSFKSGDGERWDVSLRSGKTYNLLSDNGVALNGRAKTIDGETVFDLVGLKVGGSNITLAADGTFKIDGKDFKKGRNDLDGAISLKSGTYTITTDEGYTFQLKANDTSGVTINIDAKDVGADGIAPDGLWGATFDGEKQTESELKKDFKPRNYEINDVLTFDYEDNNNLKGKSSLHDEDKNQLLFNAENPELRAARIFMNSTVNKLSDDKFAVWGPGYTEDDADWTMVGLKPNRTYNVFSDEGIQVNGKFVQDSNNRTRPSELGIVVNGEEVKVTHEGGKMKVTVNGSLVTNYNSDGIRLSTNGSGEPILTIKTDDEESWEMNIGADPNGLRFNALGANIGSNNVRTTGILGEALLSSRLNPSDYGANGSGYLRDEDGALTKVGQNMRNALAAYEVDDLFDTSSGRSVYG